MRAHAPSLPIAYGGNLMVGTYLFSVVERSYDLNETMYTIENAFGK